MIDSYEAGVNNQPQSYSTLGHRGYGQGVSCEKSSKKLKLKLPLKLISISAYIQNFCRKF